MNVTTLPADRPRRTQQGASRSGGRTTARQAEQNNDAPTIGATALQPERGTTQPAQPGSPPRTAATRSGHGCGSRHRHRSAHHARRSWRSCSCWCSSA